MVDEILFIVRCHCDTCFYSYKMGSATFVWKGMSSYFTTILVLQLLLLNYPISGLCIPVQKLNGGVVIWLTWIFWYWQNLAILCHVQCSNIFGLKCMIIAVIYGIWYFPRHQISRLKLSLLVLCSSSSPTLCKLCCSNLMKNMSRCVIHTSPSTLLWVHIRLWQILGL